MADGRSSLQFARLFKPRLQFDALNLTLGGVLAHFAEKRLGGHAHDQYQHGDEDMRLSHEKSMPSRPDLCKVQM